MLDWLDRRAGIKKLIALMLLEGVPGGARWRYVWGSCLAFVFSLQLITGIMLMTAYSPSESQAWASVHFIQYQMDFGWLVRGLHHFGSQTMMVLIGLHMLQVVIAGAHLPPRELNWWTGIGLLSVTLGLSLTGYLLPWDQKGYWATDVATNIAGSLPFFGGDVKQQAVGGPDSGNHTLTRFYALHVAILPGSLILLLIVHIAIFRRQGVTCKQNIEGLVAKPENEHSPGSESFWPRQAFYDMIACMFVFAVMMGLVLYGFAHPVETPSQADNGDPEWYTKIARAGTEGKGAELDAAADRSTANYPARPEWYFLFLFQLLKYFPGETAIYGTVVIPNGVMVLLVLLPLFGYGPMRKFGHLFGILVVVTVLTAAGLLTLKALDDDKPDGILGGILKNTDKADKKAQDAIEKAEHFVESTHEAERVAQRACQLAMEGVPVEGGHFLIRNDPFIKGQELFKTKCAVCHTFSALEGDKFKSIDTGKTASDLGNFGSREWVRGLLANPMDDKHFGLVKIKEKDENGKEVKDDKGNVKWIHPFDTMKTWRAEIDAARKDDKWSGDDVAKQEKDFDHIADWLALQRVPQDNRPKEIDPGQNAFFDKKNKCSGCHSIEKLEVETPKEGANGGKKAPPTEKRVFVKRGGKTGPDLTNYGSAEWIRGMIMNPAQKTRYGPQNLMPAFRNQVGPGSEILLEEFRAANKGNANTTIMELSDVERELIIRWILRDYAPVYGGTPIRK